MGVPKVVVGMVGGLTIVAVSAMLAYGVMSLTVGRVKPAPAVQPPVTVKKQTELVVKEWAVVVPLTDSISDARYYFTPTIGPDTITVTSKRATDLLGKVEGCRSGLYGPSIQRVLTSQKPSRGTVYLSTETYRYEQPAKVEAACMPGNVPAELVVVLGELEQAIHKIHHQ